MIIESELPLRPIPSIITIFFGPGSQRAKLFFSVYKFSFNKGIFFTVVRGVEPLTKRIFFAKRIYFII
jgi:hypothetical protein